jgi:hypothetical protein
VKQKLSSAPTFLSPCFSVFRLAISTGTSRCLGTSEMGESWPYRPIEHVRWVCSYVLYVFQCHPDQSLLLLSKTRASVHISYQIQLFPLSFFCNRDLAAVPSIPNDDT